MRDAGKFFTIPNAVVFEYGTRISPGALRVLLSISARISQKTGRSFPSYTQIEKDWNISRDTIARGVKELIDEGILTMEKHGQRNVYQYAHLTSQTTEPVRSSDQPVRSSDQLPVRSSDANNTKLTRRINKTNLNTPYSPPFEEFWLLWPTGDRKINKAGAYRIWQRDNLDRSSAKVIAGLEQWITSAQWHEKEGKYIPLVTTWLDQARYDAAPRQHSDNNGHAGETFAQKAMNGSVAAIDKVTQMMKERENARTAPESRNGRRFLQSGDEGTERRVSAHVRGNGSHDDSMGEVPRRD